MGYVILLWHSLSLPYNYFDDAAHILHDSVLVNGIWFSCSNAACNTIKVLAVHLLSLIET